MANIIRCKLPDGVHRFKPFTLKDYRDFLLVRNDLNNQPLDEQKLIVNELIDDYYSNYPQSWRPYIFLETFIGSIGKTKMPVVFECPVCKKQHKRLFNIKSPELTNPVLKLQDNLCINFKYPDQVIDNIEQRILSSIDTINFNNKVYNWVEVSENSKNDILSLIKLDQLEQIAKSLNPLYLELNISCCETQKLIYNDITTIFKLLINPDEIFSFYDINGILVSNGYDHDSIMNLLPAERTMILALVERKNKK